MLNKSEIMDLSFLEFRGKLLEVAAFLDRVDRSDGKEDYRMPALREAVKALLQNSSNRAETVLNILSDQTSAPIEMTPNYPVRGAASTTHNN